MIMTCNLDKLSSSLIVSAISPPLMVFFSWWENIFFYFWYLTNFFYWFLSKRLRCLIELQLRGAPGVVVRCVPVLRSAFEILISQCHVIQKRYNQKKIKYENFIAVLDFYAGNISIFRVSSLQYFHCLFSWRQPEGIHRCFRQFQQRLRADTTLPVYPCNTLKLLPYRCWTKLAFYRGTQSRVKNFKLILHAWNQECHLYKYSCSNPFLLTKSIYLSNLIKVFNLTINIPKCSLAIVICSRTLSHKFVFSRWLKLIEKSVETTCH